jgi:hypothetical protein
VEPRQLKDFSDEELHDEIVRRAKWEGPSNDPTDAPGHAWSSPEEISEGETPENDLEEIAKLARARTREILSIPIDPAAENVAAVVRNLNTAAATVLSLVAKLKPTLPDRLPEMLERARIVQKEIWATYERTECLEKLVRLDDDEIACLLADRIKFLSTEEGRAYARHAPDSEMRHRFICEYEQ